MGLGDWDRKVTDRATNPLESLAEDTGIITSERDVSPLLPWTCHLFVSRRKQ